MRSRCKVSALKTASLLPTKTHVQGVICFGDSEERRRGGCCLRRFALGGSTAGPGWLLRPHQNCAASILKLKKKSTCRCRFLKLTYHQTEKRSSKKKTSQIGQTNQRPLRKKRQSYSKDLQLYLTSRIILGS